MGGFLKMGGQAGGGQGTDLRGGRVLRCPGHRVGQGRPGRPQAEAQ